MPTRDELIRYYGELTDDQLMRIGLYEADELTQEALEVLKAELRTRGLGKDMEEAIEVQTCLLSPGDQEELVACFRQLPCPICGATGGSLNAGTVATARSFIIMTTREERLVVGCPKCIVASMNAISATNFSPEPTTARSSVWCRGPRFAARWFRLCSVSGDCGSGRR